MRLDRDAENLPMIFLEAFSYFNDGGLGQVQSSYGGKQDFKYGNTYIYFVLWIWLKKCKS